MGFFIQDLHKHITELHSQQYDAQKHSGPFTVYRGQGLFQSDFEQLLKTKGGLMSFNNFLSTSLDRSVSFVFAESILTAPDLVAVLFEITINPSISSSAYANIKNVSNYQDEEEILFSMHSVFRIAEIKAIDGNTRLWQVHLTLTNDNDPQLHALTECMREETFPHRNGWYRLGTLLCKLGQFDQAKELYDILLEKTTDDIEITHVYHMFGMINDSQGNYTEAIRFYEKSIEIKQKISSLTDSDLAPSYSGLGLAYKNMGEYSKALSNYRKAVVIEEKTLPENHPHLAISYNNVAVVYNNMGEHLTALSYHEKALEIQQKNFPENHPDFAQSYNNIGLVYGRMGQHPQALSYYGKALEICRKTLPTDHPHFATSYNNVAQVYENMAEHSKALLYYKKALEIFGKTFPANHPALEDIQKSIELVSKNL